MEDVKNQPFSTCTGRACGSPAAHACDIPGAAFEYCFSQASEVAASLAENHILLAAW